MIPVGAKVVRKPEHQRDAWWVNRTFRGGFEVNDIFEVVTLGGSLSSNGRLLGASANLRLFDPVVENTNLEDWL